MKTIGLVLATLLATGAAAKESADQPAPPLTLVATAVRCHWRYAYARPDGGSAVFEPQRQPCAANMTYCAQGLDPDRAAAVPVGAPVRLLATSADKPRVLAVPPLHLEVDALPGQTHAATLDIKEEGLYPGRQGADCAGDPTAIAPAFRALAPAAFDDWLKATQRRR